MADSHPEVIRAGDENGNGMIVRITLSSASASGNSWSITSSDARTC